jgi:hypothetical protein
MTDAGMPMPALVLRMPMPNYVRYRIFEKINCCLSRKSFLFVKKNCCEKVKFFIIVLAFSTGKKLKFIKIEKISQTNSLARTKISQKRVSVFFSTNRNKAYAK